MPSRMTVAAPAVQALYVNIPGNQLMETCRGNLNVVAL